MSGGRQVAPQVPRAVFDEVETLVAHLIKGLEDDDNAWAMHTIITREVLDLLDKRGVLCAPISSKR